jgi:predicted ATPase
MKISQQMRLLQNKWTTGTGWPKRLESLGICDLRGWTGQTIDFKFPIVAICGENGSGKSTILQSAASVYSMPEGKVSWYASDFFPDTPWDSILNASIKYTIRQGKESIMGSVRKPGERWRGNKDRPERYVEYIDLARIQPVSARTGYLRLAKSTVKESSASSFGENTISRLSDIMGRSYATGKMAITDADDTRSVPVISLSGTDKDVSGFHLGAGEFTMIELLQKSDPKQYSLMLIDEVETSLHPRAQRRLIRDLAELCRQRELQIILTTHSPYILEELPSEARAYILTNGNQKEVVFGVSPDFAMTKMDEASHPECDLYVEDDRAKTMLEEILFNFSQDLLSRVQIIAFGAASVGQALGEMVKAKKFPRPSLVFLDGDQPVSEGCILLPGGDAPERVVFEALKSKQWTLLDAKTSRDFAVLSDACIKSMSSSNHHEWVISAASKVHLAGETLWQAMCAQWAGNCLNKDDAEKIVTQIKEALL